MMSYPMSSLSNPSVGPHAKPHPPSERCFFEFPTLKTNWCPYPVVDTLCPIYNTKHVSHGHRPRDKKT